MLTRGKHCCDLLIWRSFLFFTSFLLVYPSLTNVALSQLEILVAETPNPIPEIIEIWAERLGATPIDVTTWIKLQRAQGPTVVSGPGSLSRNTDVKAGPSHLPTPAKSTSPETDSHHLQEDNESSASSPLLSSSSTRFPMSASSSTQFPFPMVGIKDEPTFSPATARFPFIPPPPLAPPRVTPIIPDAASTSSASVVSRMMRNGEEQSPVLLPQPAPDPNLTINPASQISWPKGHSLNAPSSTNIVTNMVIDTPGSPSVAPSSPSPVRISRELKLGLSAIAATVTVTSDIPQDYPKTLAEFEERFAKYEPMMLNFLEKVDNGSLKPLGFDPGTYMVIDAFPYGSVFHPPFIDINFYMEISGVVLHFHLFITPMRDRVLTHPVFCVCVDLPSPDGHAITLISRLSQLTSDTYSICTSHRHRAITEIECIQWRISNLRTMLFNPSSPHKRTHSLLSNP